MNYLIKQRGIYWRANSAGYSQHIGEAGIYDEKNAQGILRGRRDPPDFLVPINKELLEELIQERDRSQKMIHNLNEMIELAELEEER